MKKTFEISGRAEDEAKDLGVSDFVRLKEMIVKSRPVTHPEGNRQYNDFLFNVVNGVVCSVKRFSNLQSLITYKCDVCKDSTRVPVYEVCMYCEGKSVKKNGKPCLNCTGGEVLRYIPCQSCNYKKRFF